MGGTMADAPAAEVDVTVELVRHVQEWLPVLRPLLGIGVPVPVRRCGSTITFDHVGRREFRTRMTELRGTDDTT
jgi:hypothetical protein